MEAALKGRGGGYMYLWTCSDINRWTVQRRARSTKQVGAVGGRAISLGKLSGLMNSRDFSSEKFGQDYTGPSQYYLQAQWAVTAQYPPIAPSGACKIF